MAVNQSHTESRRGALIPSGESVLKQCEDVDLCFLQKPVESYLFNGTKKGTLFLTSYRVVFVTSHLVNDPMLSFMMPFGLMSDCTIEQPIFAPNYIKGTIQAAPGGGWEGQAVFKLSFRKGGAIEFAQLMVKAASAAARGIPLGSVNYWFDTSGLYIITVPGAAVCSSQTPCPGPFTTFSELNLEDSPSKGHPKTEVTVRRKTQVPGGRRCLCAHSGLIFSYTPVRS
nr:postacrosomal sheath WW domain-binding protein isoform X2 [Bubalus bubalis]